MKNRFKSTILLITFSLCATIVSAYNIGKVVIDAGHGGHDVGCLGSKAKEKDVALGIALKLGSMISDQHPDVRVIYTRKTDEFIELHERAAIANNAKADLFICIHCNSACYRDTRKRKDVCNDDIYGVETWVMGLHVAGANLEVAKRENEVVLLEKDYTKKYDGFDPNSPEANIIFSLYQNTFLDQSLRLASLIEDEISKKGREVRGVKQAGFLVLYKTTMPSVLIETGFLTNPAEEKFLASAKGQETIAHSIYNAFRTYKRSLEGKPIASTSNHVDSNVKTHEQEPASPQETKPMGVKADSILVPRKTRPKEQRVDTNGIEVAIPAESKTFEPKKKAVVDTSAGTVYEFAVQIFLSKTWVSPSDGRFKGLSNVHDEIDNGMFKYTVGNFKNFNEAVNEQRRMREKGYADAFVVAYKNGKRIPAPQALKELK